MLRGTGTIGNQHGGTVTISIDLELEIEHYTSQAQGHLDRVRGQLIDLLEAHQIPATWAVADPARSAASEPILASRVRHEIAVLGDRAWVGYGAGRSRLERELARRFDGARRVGMAVTTLALCNSDRLLDLDLLLARGITAIRGPAVDTATEARRIGARRIGPRPARHGIWQAPTAWMLPPRGAWWLLSAWGVRREIQRAASAGSLLHLEVSAPRLIELGEPAAQIVENLIAALARQRDQGQLQVLTLAAIAGEALSLRAAAPSHSILRPAA